MKNYNKKKNVSIRWTYISDGVVFLTFVSKDGESNFSPTEGGLNVVTHF